MTYRCTTFLLPAILLISLAAAVTGARAMDPRFELDPAELQKNLPRQEIPAPVAVKSEEMRRGSGETTYTVKRGDTLIGILMRNFGLSRQDARSLVPEITERNRLERPGLIRTGEQLIIPLQAKRAKRQPQTARAARLREAPPSRERGVSHRLTLYSGDRGASGNGLAGARVVWGKLLPGKTQDSSYAVKGNRFALDLDPVRYPVFPAATGAKIVVEAGGELSPLVRSLIQQQEPGTRFVAYSPGNSKKFFADLLDAAGFYSVEQDFSVSFGDDPKLTVTTDFKVENDSESPLRNDIFLFDVTPARGGFPQPLADYMGRQGFRIIDISPPGQAMKPRSSGNIAVISEREPSALADRLLSELKLNFVRNREVDLLDMAESGVGLRVKVERYFEKNGEKYVLSVYRGDPVNYTLLRLLESMGYRVVMLTPDDNLRTAAVKLFSRLDLPTRYAMQELLPTAELSYSIRMSGIMINSAGSGGRLFLTETRPDPVISELLQLNGYSIRDSKDELVRK